MDYVGFGRHVRYYRKQLHMTQEKLAELSGISLSFLGHIERGTRKASLETLIALANALKVSPDVLLQDSLDNELVGLPQESTKRQRHLINEISKLLIADDPDIPK